MAGTRQKNLLLLFLGVVLVFGGAVVFGNFTGGAEGEVSLGVGAYAYAPLSVGGSGYEAAGVPGAPAVDSEEDVRLTHAPDPSPSEAEPPPIEPDADIPVVWRDRPDDGFTEGAGRGAISGRVTDPWGNGIAGVGIYIDDPNWTNCPKYCSGYRGADGFTDSAGYYTVFTTYTSYPYSYDEETYQRDPILNGSHKVFFSGRVSGVRAFEWYNNSRGKDGATFVPAGSSGVDAVLVPAGTLAGRVHGAGNQNVIIAAYRVDRPEPVAVANADRMFGTADGDFLFDLPPGAYKLVAYPLSINSHSRLASSWYDRAATWEQARVISISPGQTVSVNFFMKQNDAAVRGSISGQFLMRGHPPLPGAIVSLADADDPGRIIAKKTVSQDDFNFDFRDLPVGSYKLRYNLPGSGGGGWYSVLWYANSDFEDAEEIIISPEDPSQSIDFNARPDGSRIEGRVVRPDGSGVPGAIVMARRLGGFSYWFVEQAYADSSGTFRYSGTAALPAGTYQLCVQDREHATWKTLEEYCQDELVTSDWFGSVEGNEIVVPHDFGWPIELSGRVHTPDGSAANVVSVDITRVMTDNVTLSTTADTSGRYRFDAAAGLTPAVYRLCADVRDGAGDTARFCYRGYSNAYEWATYEAAWNYVNDDADLIVPQEYAMTETAVGAAIPSPASAGADGSESPAVVVEQPGTAGSEDVPPDPVAPVTDSGPEATGLPEAPGDPPVPDSAGQPDNVAILPPSTRLVEEDA